MCQEQNITKFQKVGKLIQVMNMNNINHIVGIMDTHPTKENFNSYLTLFVNEACENIRKVPLILEACRQLAALKSFKMVAYKKHFKTVIEKRFEDICSNTDSGVTRKDENLAKFTAILSNNSLLNKNALIAICKTLVQEIFRDRLDLTILFVIMMKTVDRDTFNCESRLAIENLSFIIEDIQTLLDQTLLINVKCDILDILKILNVKSEKIVGIIELEDEEGDEDDDGKNAIESENFEKVVQVERKFNSKGFKNLLLECRFHNLKDLTIKLKEFTPLSSTCVGKITSILFSGEIFQKFEPEMFVNLAVIVDKVDKVSRVAIKVSNEGSLENSKSQVRLNDPNISNESQVLLDKDTIRSVKNFINETKLAVNAGKLNIREMCLNNQKNQDFKTIFTRKVLMNVIEFFEMKNNEKITKELTKNQMKDFESLLKILAELFNESWIVQNHVFEIFHALYCEASKSTQKLINRQYYVEILKNFITTCTFKLMKCDNHQVFKELLSLFKNPGFHLHTFHDQVEYQEVVSKIENIIESRQINVNGFNDALCKSSLEEFIEHFEAFEFDSLETFYKFLDIFIKHACVGSKFKFSKAAAIINFHFKRHLTLKCIEKLQNGGQFFENLGLIDFISELYVCDIAKVEDVDKCIQILLIEEDMVFLKYFIKNVAGKMSNENSALFSYYFEVFENQLSADEFKHFYSFIDNETVESYPNSYKTLMFECSSGNPDAVALKFLKINLKHDAFVEVLFEFLIKSPESILKYVQLYRCLSQFGVNLQPSFEKNFIIQRQNFMNSKINSSQLLAVLIFIVQLHHFKLISDTHFQLWTHQQLLIKLKCDHVCDFYKNIASKQQKSSMMEVLCENINHVIGEHLKEMKKQKF
jgi:hypothetical protein